MGTEIRPESKSMMEMPGKAPQNYAAHKHRGQAPDQPQTGIHQPYSAQDPHVPFQVGLAGPACRASGPVACWSGLRPHGAGHFGPTGLAESLV